MKWFVVMVWASMTPYAGPYDSLSVCETALPMIAKSQRVHPSELRCALVTPGVKK